MNRQEVINALRARNVDIPIGANVAQLRVLLHEANNERPPDVNDVPADVNAAPPAPDVNDVPADVNAAPPAPDVNANAPEVPAVQQEIALLRQQRELLLLRREVAELQNPQIVRPVEIPRVSVDYSKIVKSINDFVGDDSYDVNKYIRDFNQLLDAHQCPEATKYLLLRQKLDGTAKLWLQLTEVNDFVGLCAAMRCEFRKHYTRHEIHCQLNKRARKSDESLKRYLMELQVIASQTDIEEIEVIHAFIRGLRDTSTAATMLYSANTVDELKRLLDKYEQVRAITGATNTGVRLQAAKPIASKAEVKTSI